MRRFFVGILALVPVVAVACGDDEDDGVVQAGGAGGSSGSSGEAGAGGEREPSGGSSGTPTGGVGGESGGGGRSSGGEGGGQGDPRCSYDLKSYDGDTEGLCDAVEVNRCDEELCGDYGAAISVLCAPDKSGCIYAGGICTKNTECGWIDCDGARVDEFCDGLEDLVDEVKRSGGPRRCVRDEDCSAPATCSRRIDNMMVCDPNDWSQGGNGGEGGGE